MQREGAQPIDDPIDQPDEVETRMATNRSVSPVALAVIAVLVIVIAVAIWG